MLIPATPSLGNKVICEGNEIIQCENDKIVSDQGDVCNIFNKYFVNVAKEIEIMPLSTSKTF